MYSIYSDIHFSGCYHTDIQDQYRIGTALPAVFESEIYWRVLKIYDNKIKYPD